MLNESHSYRVAFFIGEKMNNITELQFNEAVEDKNNIKIMAVAGASYSKILGEELIVVKLSALWKTMKEFDEDRGMKFTTLLYTNVRRQCFESMKKIMKEKKKRKQEVSINNAINFGYQNSTLMNDIIMSLNPKEAKLLNDRFIMNKTLQEIGLEEGVTSQRINQRVDALLDKIKQILTY